MLRNALIAITLTLSPAALAQDGAVVDSVVNAVVDAVEDFVVDFDLDGVPASEDCDDTDPRVHPDSFELPGNTVDEDCDGQLGACPVDGPWHNDWEFRACVIEELDVLTDAGMLDERERKALIKAARRGPTAEER